MTTLKDVLCHQCENATQSGEYDTQCDSCQGKRNVFEVLCIHYLKLQGGQTVNTKKTWATISKTDLVDGLPCHPCVVILA